MLDVELVRLLQEERDSYIDRIKSQMFDVKDTSLFMDKIAKIDTAILKLLPVETA